MKKITKLFFIVLGIKKIRFLKKIYYSFFYNIIFLSSFFKKKIDIKIKKPADNFLLISQIQRSGGTLLTQLLDGHKNLSVHPYELILTDPKWEWGKKKNFYCYNNKFRIFSKEKKYFKSSKATWNKKYDFYFDLIKQRKIFDSLTKKNDNFKKKLINYFLSFFMSFENYKTELDFSKYFVAFVPRLTMSDKSLEIFFENFHEGKILCIVRDPLNWLSSAKRHSKDYLNLNNALNLWYASNLKNFDLFKKNKKFVKIIIFEHLITDTKKQMKEISEFLKIEFDDYLLIPTFNKEKILSDSSFKTVEGKIDYETLDRKQTDLKEFSKNIDKTIINECEQLYQDINAYLR
jgi:hypothetical protein